MRKKLTEVYLKSVKPPASGRLVLVDAELPGLSFRVTAKGARSWLIRYRVNGQSAQRNATPGPYPVISLAEARQRAREIIAAAKRGTDLIDQERRQTTATEAVAEVQRSNSVRSVVGDFVKRHLEPKRTAGYVRETQRIFDKYVLPPWGDRDINAITRRDVLDLLDGLVDRGSPVMANRVLAAVRKLFNWAIGRDIIVASPVTNIEPPGQETKRERTLSAEELRLIWPQMAALGYPFGHFLQLALALGQRRTEVARMRWADLDETERTWTVPSADTKAGRAHVVPLSPLAWTLVLQAKAEAQRLPAVSDGRPVNLGPYVFTTTGDRPINGFSRAKDRIDVQIARLGEPMAVSSPRRMLRASGMDADGGGRRMELVAEGHEAFKPDHLQRVIGLRHDGQWGYARLVEIMSPSKAAVRVLVPFSRIEPTDIWLIGPEPWTFHDLRRTVGTGLGKLGVSRFIIARVLNHADASVTGIYDRYEYLAEKRQALDAWASYVGNVTAPSANNEPLVIKSLTLSRQDSVRAHK